jgi:hypothetical protein
MRSTDEVQKHFPCQPLAISSYAPGSSSESDKSTGRNRVRIFALTNFGSRPEIGEIIAWEAGHRTGNSARITVITVTFYLDVARLFLYVNVKKLKSWIAKGFLCEQF